MEATDSKEIKMPDKELSSPPLAPIETQHEGQVADSRLDRSRFSIWSTIGIQFSVTAAPLAIPSYTVLIAGAGGSPFFFWAFLTAAVGQMLVAMSLAELASAYPDTSGQVYWTAAVSHPKWARFLSYFSGALTSFGWIFACGGAAVLASQFLTALGALVNETYSPTTWQLYLIVIGVFLFAVLFNTLLIRMLPAITSFLVVFLNAAALFIFLTLVIKTNPKASAHTAFVDVINQTGWGSEGVVFFLATLPGLLTICLFDTAAHMAGELPQPERQVPIVMLVNAGLSAIAALVMVIGLIFCTTHPENLVQPLAGLPILQICWDAWQNKGYVIAVCLVYWVMTLGGLTTMLTGCSRLVWSFAELGSVPFRNWFSYVHPGLQVPINAIYFSSVLAALFSLLVFGPDTVLNGLFGSSILCFSISYALPMGLTLVNRGKLPARRYFNLGAFGFLVNTVALAWLCIILVFASFPTYVPVTSETMNWAPCFFGIVAALSLVNWVFVRKTYRQPRGMLTEDSDSPLNG